MNGRHRYDARGFTIVELMMSLAVFAVGITGIVAMQKVTAMTNMHSKSVATATQIAKAWQDQLLVDGSIWRRTKTPGNSWTITTTINSTTWLRNYSEDGKWLRPTFDANRQFGAAFDALGNPVNDNNTAQAYFCVHQQIVPIFGDRVSSDPTVRSDPSNATVRATIRVLWPRAQGSPVANYCGAGADPSPDAVGNDTTNFHSIYQTVAIRVHP